MQQQCLQHDYIYVHFHESIIHVRDWCSGNDWLECIFMCILRYSRFISVSLSLCLAKCTRSLLSLQLLLLLLFILAIATDCALMQSWYSIHKTVWWILNWKHIRMTFKSKAQNMLCSLFIEKVLSIFDMDYIYCMYGFGKTTETIPSHPFPFLSLHHQYPSPSPSCEWLSPIVSMPFSNWQ